MHSLALLGRPTRGEQFIRDLTPIARGWRRSSKAVGGYHLGSFTIGARDMHRPRMEKFFEQNLGCVVQEYCGGQLSWEGIIYEMRLVVDGAEEMRSLDPAITHNSVDVLCAYPPPADSEQGGPYAWDPADPLDSFQDESQDFSDWETNPASPPAAYRLRVTATDGVVIWGFMGLAFGVGDDSIYIYEDVGLTDEGWAVDHVPGGRASKTVDTYTVELVNQAVRGTTLGFVENADSVEEYGRIQFLETQGNLPPESAEGLQQKHLVENAWPRSIPAGGVTIGSDGKLVGDGLVVVVAGFWHTCNNVYLSTSTQARAMTAMADLAALTEFVTAGRIEENFIAAYLDCMIPQRVGDLMENVINLGDLNYNPWQAGVYQDRELIFEQAPTTAEYLYINKTLLDKAGRRVLLPLVKPGFLMQIGGRWGGQPVGSSSVWDDVSVDYVDQVEYIAPGRLKLNMARGDQLSIVSIMEQQRQAQPVDRWPLEYPKPPR